MRKNGTLLVILVVLLTFSITPSNLPINTNRSYVSTPSYKLNTVGISIEYNDSVYVGLGLVLVLNWTATLDEGYTPFQWELFDNNSYMINDGGFTSGVTVSYDITSYLTTTGIYNFTMRFSYRDASYNYYSESGVTIVHVYTVEPEIIIEQVESVTINLGEPLVLNWTAYLPEGYTPFQWEFFSNDSYMINDGGYTNATPVYYNVTDFLTVPGWYNFTMTFSASYAGNYIHTSCSIIVYVEELTIEPEIIIEQVESVTITLGEPLVLNWTAYLPEDYTPFQWELFNNDSYMINDGGYTNATPVYYNVTDFLTIPGWYNFTMTFSASYSGNYIHACCSIIVYVEEVIIVPEIIIEQVEGVTVDLGKPLILNWTAYLSEGCTPLQWELFSNDSYMIADGGYTNATPIYYNVTDFLTMPGYYNFTMTFSASYAGNYIYTSCSIIVRVELIYNITISEGETTIEVPGTDVTLELNVSDEVTVTVKASSTPPEGTTQPGENIVTLGEFIEVDVSDPSAIRDVWINISYADLDLEELGADESNLRIVFFNTTANEWQLAGDTGVDTVNKIIYAHLDHLTVFGAVSMRTTSTANNVPPDQSTTSSVFGFELITILSILVLHFFYLRKK